MDLSHDEILNALRSGVEYRFPVSVRGLTVKMRPLTLMETNNIESDVAEMMVALPEARRTSLAESTMRAKRTLVLATTSAPNQTDAKLDAKILDMMTNEEVAALHKEYLSVQEKANPSLETMPLDRLEELVGILKKSLDERDLRSALMQFSFLQLADMVSHLLKTSGE